MATLKRWRYGRHSEQLEAVQRSLLDESIDADLEAISLEIDALREKPPSAPKSPPRRVALPASFPGREIRHEPENTQCRCGCSLERIGEDVSEKLDTPLGCSKSSAMCPSRAARHVPCPSMLGCG
jgi:hypothetical protein